MKDLFKRKLITNLLALKHIPSASGEQRAENRIINRAVWLIQSGEALRDETKEYVCNHKEVIPTDENGYFLANNSPLTFNVYYKDTPLATFYKSYYAGEYLCMLNNLL